MKLFAIFIAITFVLPAFLGCKKGPPAQAVKTPVAVAQKIETQPAPVPEKAPEVQGQSYVYEPKGRPDPFVPLVETIKKEKGRKGVTGTLESYDIVDFTLIAVVVKEKQKYGLLLAPDNKSYTILEGAVLGFHKGKVEKIMPDKVIIIEYIKDYKGELKPREVVLRLHKEEGEE